MLLIPLKRVQFNTFLVSPQKLALNNYSSHHQLSNNFLSSLSLLSPYKNNNRLPYKENNQPFLYAPKLYQPHHISPIGLEGASNLLFTTCCRVEKENKAEIGVFSKESSDVNYSSLEKDSDVNDLSSGDEDHWEDGADRGV